MFLNPTSAKFVHPALLFLRVQRRAGRDEAPYPRETPKRSKDESNKFRISFTAKKVSKISTWVLRFSLSPSELSWGYCLYYRACCLCRRGVDKESMLAGRTIIATRAWLCAQMGGAVPDYNNARLSDDRPILTGASGLAKVLHHI